MFERPEMKRITKAIIGMLLVCITSLISVCGAPQPTAGIYSNPVTLDLNHVSLLVAVQKLFEQSHVEYQIAPDAKEYLASEYRTVHFENKPFQQVLSDLLHVSMYSYQWYTYTFEGGVCNIRGPKVAFEEKNVEAVTALQHFFEQTHVNFMFSPQDIGTKKVNVKISSKSFNSALKGLLKQLQGDNLQCVRQTNVFVIKERSSKRKKQEDHQKQNEPISLGRTYLDRKHLTYGLEAVDIADFLKALFEVENMSYVQSVPLEGTIYDSGSEQEFHTMLGKALDYNKTSATYEIQGGVCFIRYKALIRNY